MSRYQVFAAVFTSTVVVTRFALWLYPTPSPTIRGVRLHHWMFGAIILMASVAWEAATGGFRPLVQIQAPLATSYAVGTGLLVDELTFLATGGRTHADNYSTISLVGTALLVVAVDAILLLAQTR